jgi:hypothetical protein
VSQPGEPHTVGPAGETAVEMVVEFRPALGFEAFVERTFALDRAGHLSPKGPGNPLRLATARPHEAEFFLPRVSVGLQRALLRRWIGLADGSSLAADDCRQRGAYGQAIDLREAPGSRRGGVHEDGRLRRDRAPEPRGRPLLERTSYERTCAPSRSAASANSGGALTCLGRAVHTFA